MHVSECVFFSAVLARLSFGFCACVRPRVERESVCVSVSEWCGSLVLGAAAGSFCFVQDRFDL